MERVDLNLVVSLCSGLGSFQVLDDGRRPDVNLLATRMRAQC